MILFLFFCSGATALVYEVVWSKYLALMFGSTVHAQTVVLAVFMGGLALGNRLIGARSDLLRKPLAVYGYLEVAIGLYAFSFNWLYQQTDHLFVLAGSRLFEHPGWLLLLKGALSLGLLLFPTILMGGTLPLLSAWLQRQSADAGRWSARFYSTNSLGAVFGAWLAGFCLIRAAGLVSTLQMTALANVVIGFTAVGLARRHAGAMASHKSPPVPGVTEASGTSRVRPWLLIVVALTGGVSMGLEVLASRSLALIFGASLQAFAIVLMAFILGIGVGSAAMASPRLNRWRSLDLIFLLLLMAGVLIGLLVLGIEHWVEAYRLVRTGLARTAMGYQFYQIVAGGFSLVLLGIPAALIGAVLPLCIRLAAEHGTDLGNRVGRLLTWNTLGAVVGVLLTGFAVMPTAGLRNAFNLLAVALCIPVCVLAWRAKRPGFAVTGGLLAGALLLSCALGGEGWRHVLSSGVFRAREVEVDSATLALRKKHVKILFYKDAADATITVEQGDGVGAPSDLGLRINGKPDASTRGDMGTQLLIAHLPMLARPESKDVFVLGLASGISCGALLAYPIENLVVAENCAPVIQATRFFAAWNRGVLTNRVTRLLMEDARTILKLSPQEYDVIVSQPSNPWFASVGSVFSLEYYQLAASRLKPGGIMAQWFHVYEMHDGIANLVLRTFGAVFPHMEIWDSGSGDIILLGSNRPWDSSLERLREAYQRPLVREDLTSVGFSMPEALLARQFASQRTAFAIAGNGPLQSDGFPLLEYDAPLAFYIGTAAAQLMRFDERTWQSSFVSEERRTALTELNAGALRRAFGNMTINKELGQVLAQRLQEDRTAETSQLPMPGRMPCLFSPAVIDTEEAFPPDASEDVKRLLRAEAALQRRDGRLLGAVQAIRNVLAAQFASQAARSVDDRSVVHFAIVAARASLGERQYGIARELLTWGLSLKPDDPELAYLARILEREKGGAVEDLPR